MSQAQKYRILIYVGFGGWLLIGILTYFAITDEEHRPLFVFLALFPLIVAIAVNAADWWQHRGDGSPPPSREPDA